MLPSKEYYKANREKCIEYQRKYVEKYPEKILANRIRFKDSINASHAKWWANLPQERKLLKWASNRARKLGVPFDLSAEDIIVPSVCPILKINLYPSKGCLSNHSPTVDRIIPDKGYTKGNIQIISHLANTMKNSASVEQLKDFAQWILKTF